MDIIRSLHAKNAVESECQIMDLHVKAAQDQKKEILSQITTLIESLPSDAIVKDGIYTRWNEEVGKGEMREICKWEKKLDRLQKFPDDPSLEDQELNPPPPPSDTRPQNSVPTNPNAASDSESHSSTNDQPGS